MELVYEEKQQEDGYILVSLYAKEFGTTVLMDQKKYLPSEFHQVKDVIDDYNERPWNYPAWTRDMSTAIYEARMNEVKSSRLQRIDTHVKAQAEVKAKTQAEIDRQAIITAKIKATRLANLQSKAEMHEFVDAMKKEASAKHKIDPDDVNYYSSSMDGFHNFHVYTEPSMSDDCFGFGNIRVCQTIDSESDRTYDVYDDYIF